MDIIIGSAVVFTLMYIIKKRWGVIGMLHAVLTINVIFIGLLSLTEIPYSDKISSMFLHGILISLLMTLKWIWEKKK